MTLGDHVSFLICKGMGLMRRVNGNHTQQLIKMQALLPPSMCGVLVASPPQPHGVTWGTSLPMSGLPPPLHSGRALISTDPGLLAPHCLSACEQASRWSPWSPGHSGPKSSGREESSRVFQFSLQIQPELLPWPRRSVAMTRCLQTLPSSAEHTLRPPRPLLAFRRASLPQTQPLHFQFPALQHCA